MLDRGHGIDAPAEPNGRPPDQLATVRGDLRTRLGRLSDGHPSALDYRASDHSRPNGTVLGATRADHRDRPSESGTGPAGSRDEPARKAPGWTADTSGQPHPPGVKEIRLRADRARHILDGDGPGKPGGGHRHGARRPGKTEFPENWSDAAILSTVEHVASRPDEVKWQNSGSWLAKGERGGVRVNVAVLPDGRIWTAWPEPGGPGVRQNP